MKEVAILFFRLGCMGFGGPIAVLGMMEEEVCRKRKWVSSERFAEMLAVCKLMPGPLATQVAIYVGSSRAGPLGGAVAGFLFILPAFLIVLGLSYLYVHGGVTHSAGTFLTGLQVGALVAIFISTLQLARPYRARFSAWGIGLLSGALIFWQPGWEPAILFCFGLLGAWKAIRPVQKLRRDPPRSLYSIFIGFGGMAGLSGGIASDPQLARIFWVMFKAGAFVFGSGLAIVPMLEADSIRHHWVTHQEFMEGLAIGQVTPGPVVITATFLGYKAAGLMGAIVATVGIFAPSFFNVLVLIPRVWGRLSGTRGAEGFMAWAIPAVVGGIFGTSVKLGVQTLTRWRLLLFFAFGLVATLKWRPPVWAVIPAMGAICAFLLHI